jgi:hypothetical protein
MVKTQLEEYGYTVSDAKKLKIKAMKTTNCVCPTFQPTDIKISGELKKIIELQ